MTLPQAGIWLDAQGAQNREHFDRGIPRYVTDQARAVVELVPDALQAVGLNPTLPLTGNLDWLLGTGLASWDPRRRPERLPRIYHVMSPFELSRSLDEVWPVWARTARVKTVVTLFDLIPQVFADHYLRDPALRAQYHARAELIRRADHVLAISQTTADDATKHLGVPESRITVIDAGVSNHFAEAFGSHEEAAHILRRRFPEIDRPFMLYVAGIEFRKNIDRLIRAHGRTSVAFRDRHQLVITCRMLPEAEEHLRWVMRDAGLRDDDVVLTNYVSDPELAALYRTTELFVFASFYEGSGLPILEAMACGAPVAASNTATSPEILGDRDATFDPFDEGDMARVLEATVSDDALLERLRERSERRVGEYTWRGVAEKTVAGYERALSARGPGVRRPGRGRIAMYTPWPPERSGIATYNRRLLQELGRMIDVDVVVAGGPDDHPPPQEPGVRVIAAGQIEQHRRLRAYDRTVYCMGNSYFHGHVYEGLMAHPGVVVAHDVRLTGFYAWYSGQERPQDPQGRFAERLASAYGTRLGKTFLEGGPTPKELADLGIYMTWELQQVAEQLIVHSNHARDILRLDRPFEPPPPPTTVLAHAFPDVPDELAERRAPDPEAPLIVTFGIVSSVKSPDVLIEAFALLAEDRPGARLVFAGGADPGELQRWRDLAAEAGVAERVSLPGHVDDDEWARLLAEADVAVQLRQLSNGEASGAVAGALGHGIPTVVTRRGWAAELPDDAVIKVPAELTAPVLAGALASVVDDPARAAALTAGALAHARANSFAAVARRYVEVLELD